jgi:hypothetical protein
MKTLIIVLGILGIQLLNSTPAVAMAKSINCSGPNGGKLSIVLLGKRVGGELMGENLKCRLVEKADPNKPNMEVYVVCNDNQVTLYRNTKTNVLSADVFETNTDSAFYAKPYKCE